MNSMIVCNIWVDEKNKSFQISSYFESSEKLKNWNEVPSMNHIKCLLFTIYIRYISQIIKYKKKELKKIMVERPITVRINQLFLDRTASSHCLDISLLCDSLFKWSQFSSSSSVVKITNFPNQ